MKNKIQNQRGGAIVETAIMSLIMVPLAFYSIFFYEYAMINIKTSEAARYLAWEMTAIQMTDYKNYKHVNNPNYVTDRVFKLTQEVKDRWGDDMNSATARSEAEIYDKSNGTLFNERQSGLMLSKFNSQGNESSGAFITVDLTDTSPYDGTVPPTPPADEHEPEDNDPSTLSSTINAMQNKLAGSAKSQFKKFDLNVNGFISTEVGVKMAFTTKAPIYKGENMITTSSGEGGALPTLKAKEKLVADAWDLKNGGDADFGQLDAGQQNEYLNQVDKMAFYGLINDLQNLFGSGTSGQIGDVMEDLGQIGLRVPWATVARSYALKHASAGVLHGESAVEFGERRANPFGGAQSKFYTNTFKDTRVRESSPYYRVYARQSPSGHQGRATVGYYMGCDKPQIVDRSQCWK